MMYDRKRMLTGLFVATIFIASNTAGTPIPYNKKELLEQLTRLNDENIPKALSKQLTGKSSQYYGAVYDGDSILSPIGTAGLIQTLMCGYVSRESKYYNSKEI